MWTLRTPPDPTRIPTQDDYVEAAARWSDRYADVARRTIGDGSQAYFEMYRATYESRLEAWVLGRARAGDLVPVSDDDRVEARRLADYQAEYIRNFVEATSRSSEEQLPGVVRRARMYAMSARGASSESFVSALDPETPVVWRLGGGESCRDCIALSERTYMAGTLFEYPGEGHTACKFNCNCVLAVVIDGEERTTFDRVDLL